MNHFILYKGKNIHYRVEGEGPSLVLLHGFIESLEIWNEYSASLSQDFKVISIDLPGHGKSEMVDAILTMDLMAEVVKCVMDQESINTCVMAGHSMGGYVTLAFADKYPKIVKGMIIFHSHAAGDTSEAKINRDRAIQIVRSEHTGFIWAFIPELFAPENVKKYPEQIAALRNEAAKMTADSIVAALEGMKLREDKLAFLAEYPGPVLFIIGKKDAKVQMDKMLQQIAIPQHSESLILADAGHMGYIEEKMVTLETVRCFAHRVF